MKQRGKTTSKEIQNVALVSALSSTEHIIREGGEPRHVLSDIDLSIERGQSWGITARTGYEIRLLLEIMGNIRPYDGGKCVLVERGMMRRKRVIQPHVFFIGDADMLYGNMNVLEYLMFATEKTPEDRLYMQEELFEFLIDIGLADISLTLIRHLDANEKAVVALITAAYSNSVMIVLNLPETAFSEKLQGAVARISELAITRGKSLIIGTLDGALIQKACSHTAFIADGRIIFKGTTDTLRQTYDNITAIIDDPDITGIRQRIAPALEGCSLVESGGRLLVKAEGEACGPYRIYRAIAETGAVPRSICINEKTVINAYEELIRRHDLSEKLF